MPIVGNEGDDGDGGPSGSGGGALGPASPNDDALGGPSSSNGKISKAAVLQRSIDYIHYIQVSMSMPKYNLSKILWFLRDPDHINKSSSDLAEIYRDLTYGQTPTTHEISAQ